MNELIKKYEGFYQNSYRCPAGVLTIGFGTTVYPNGKGVQEGDEITEEKAEAYLNDYLNHIKLPANLSNKQRTAVESLIYNIGQSAFEKSSLRVAIEKEDIKGIYANWDWISAGGKPLLGLAKRRSEELALFFEGM